MEKSRILSKLNLKLKDYNNQLEKILDNKLFSFDVKNLLLSMLYKVENAYEDYEISKVEVSSKNEYIENLLRIIKEKVLKIFIVKPETPEAEELEKNHIKYKIDKINGEITCFQNELIILMALVELDEVETKFKVPYEYIQKPLNVLINAGKLYTESEVIRDFNGWSWDINKKQIKDLQYNLIYQTILLLNGRKNILNTKKNKEINDIVFKIAVKKYLLNSKDNEYKQKLQELKEKKEERMHLLENKKEFLEKITEDKKKSTKEIEKIDILLNNYTLLKEEYFKRNEKLKNEDKIFSVSHLARMLEKERESLLLEIDECNKIILPKEYVEQKVKTEKELKFLDDVLTGDNIEAELIQIINLYLEKCKKKKKTIKEENKEKLIPLIYKIRYYGFIPFTKEKNVKQIEETKKNFEEVERNIIKKAQELKIWDNFTDDKELTYKILKEIFNTKIITLENINIQCRYEGTILYIEYYDDTILDSTTEIKLDKVKIKKKCAIGVRPHLRKNRRND